MSLVARLSARFSRKQICEADGILRAGCKLAAMKSTLAK